MNHQTLSIPEKPNYMTLMKLLPKDIPQHQGSLNDQLRELQAVANRLGLQDAADYLGTILK